MACDAPDHQCGSPATARADVRRRRQGLGLALACIACLALAGVARAGEGKPKLAPGAITVQQSHEYLQSHAAPDYWSLSRYYVPQATGSACSVAAIAMLLNALRGPPPRDEDQLVTQSALLDAVGSSQWLQQTSENGSGVTWEQLGTYVRASLQAFQVDADIETLRPDSNSAGTLEQVRAVLIDNERTDRDIVLAYFNQGVLTGSWDGPHISPVAAYDADRHRALIMDVDRRWYVPYWASDEKLLEALLRPAPASRGALAGERGGLIRVILKHAR
jgi:hypothetical protein